VIPTSQSNLIRSLQDPAVYDHQVEALRVVETHISWVLLTGEYAYKIKKSVDFGFVDFTTLQKRRFFCREELRLNCRLAASLYLDVVAITGSPSHPLVNGTGTPIEFAVKMKQFPQQAMLSHLLEQGRVTAAHIDGLAHEVAQFHGRIDVAGCDTCDVTSSTTRSAFQVERGNIWSYHISQSQGNRRVIGGPCEALPYSHSRDRGSNPLGGTGQKPLRDKAFGFFMRGRGCGGLSHRRASGEPVEWQPVPR